MTTYRLMDGLSGRPGNGPGTGVSYSGNLVVGCAFGVTQGGMWFTGYYWWPPVTNGDTGSGQKFALYQITGTDAGTLVPGTTVTAGTLTAGAWNFIPLSTPVLLSPFAPGSASSFGAVYMAATGKVFSSGFPETKNQFGTGDTYAAGIVNGPLSGMSSLSGTLAAGGSAGWVPQEAFTTGLSDPTAGMPTLNDSDANLWLDVQVSDTPPAAASYRAFPNSPAFVGGSDQAQAYTLGLEFTLSQACALTRIWHYSPSTATVLPTRCAIWDVATTTVVAGSDNTSPTWSGAAASGWVSCDYTGSGVTLAAGKNYKISTFTSNNTAVWFTALANFWGGSPGPFSSGITQGPLQVLSNAAATPGQDSWNQSTTWTYPATSTNPEFDGLDVEVTPLPAASAAGRPAYAPGWHPGRGLPGLPDGTPFYAPAAPGTPAAAPLTVVQAAPTVHLTSLAGPVTVTLGQPTGTGNTLVACVTTQATTTNPAVSGITLGGSADNWQADVTDPGTTQFGGTIWYDPGCAAAQTSVVVSFTAGTGGSGGLWVAVYEVSGVLAADQHADHSQGGQTSWTSGATGTTAQAAEIFFGVCTATSGVPAVTGAGTWTTQSNATGDGQVSGFQNVSATGTATFSGTMASGGYTALAATFSAGAAASAAANVAGAAAITAAATATGLSAAAVTVTAGITAAGTSTVLGAAAVAPAAAITASATATELAAAAVSGTSVITASLSVTHSAAAAVAATSAITAAATATELAAAAVATTATITAAGSTGSVAAVSTAAAITAAATLVAAASAAVTATASLTAAGQLAPATAAAAPAAAATITAGAVLTLSGSAAVSTAAAITATAGIPAPVVKATGTASVFAATTSAASVTEAVTSASSVS